MTRASRLASNMIGKKFDELNELKELVQRESLNSFPDGDKLAMLAGKIKHIRGEIYAFNYMMMHTHKFFEDDIA